MAENKMQLEDWLDDLCVRFIINLPKEDLSSVARICFQVEEAQWFYEDFIRPLDPTLPSMSLRSFCLRIFQHCPLLASFSVENHMRAFEEFLQYKTRVPVRGAILLNEAMDSTVLVKGWKKGANWSFPRGKINKDEDDLDCAIREVYEETGFDIREAGLVPRDDEVKYIQISMREQQIRLYVFRNIPMNTPFHPKTRKEISKIQWYKLSELPAFRKKGSLQDDVAAASNANKFYMVAPFLVPLKKWVVQQKKKDIARGVAHSNLAVQIPAEEPLTEDDIGQQTEPVPGPSDIIETIEGADLELQRLLQVQPAPAGQQMNPPTSSTPDKGGALMALLKKSAGEGLPSQPLPPQMQPQMQYQMQPQMPPQAYNPNFSGPQTPHDLTYTAAPEPHTPHHHHPTNRLPVHPNQPPPNFPIHPHSTQNISQGYFNQQRIPAQMQPQSSYGRNPYQNQPQPYPNQMRQPPPKEPVPLLHPQPLPPQAQAVLARSLLQTPNLPDQNIGIQQTIHNSFQPPHGQNAFQYSQQAPQQAPKHPTQLSGHAQSLLNAFKSDARAQENTPPVAAPQGPLQGGPGSQGNQQHTRYPSGGSWSGMASGQPNPAAQYLPHQMVPTTQQPGDRGAPPVSQPMGSNPMNVLKPGQAMEPHRSALLDIFKKPGTRSPLSNEITRSTQPEAPTQTAAEAIALASEANGAPLRMNPEVNLPYRAVKILSRPKQGEGTQDQDSIDSQMQRLQKRLSPTGSSRNVAPSIPSPRERSLLQELEHQQEPKRSPQLYSSAHAASNLPYNPNQSQQHPPSHLAPYGNSPTLQAQQPVMPIHQRQPSNNNPEQKQKLLSLFGSRAQASPTIGAAVPVNTAGASGKMKESTMGYDQTRPDTPRSARVAALIGAPNNAIEHNAGGPVVGAAGPGPAGSSSGGPSATNSRRGSQTPISPADRNFLLSYLESVSSSAR
ncbi:hypothetical protein QBC38DRAFT_238943 [Podospora fimiseda]|uniref:Nudix hydrolase domain-containing protein n=1 Tax=Podospora fimiseda TaxID=252190 RepID=A0AAN7BMJ0_9PEZI|nr:hypothetical protein QBC38DRAFT_238943 [Podospora fimiseda]